MAASGWSAIIFSGAHSDRKRQEKGIYMPVLVNIVAFKIGWLACVLGGASDLAWLGTLLALGIVALHISKATDSATEFRFIALAGLIGVAWDSLLASTGWLTYGSGMLFAGAAPYWIAAMWLLFATTLNVSLSWLKGRLIIAALLGAVSGPLAFYAGHKLGAVTFVDFSSAMIALAIGWAVILPGLVTLSNRLDGFATRGLMPGASTLARKPIRGY